MKAIKRKLSTFSIILLSLFVFAGNVWSEVNLPYAKFSGAVQTTPGIGTGELAVLNIVITQLFYIDSNGTPTQFNTPGVETLIGMPMTITGATRTGDYSFADAAISIGTASNTYFTAKLSNIEFVQVGNEWAMNPLLDSADPSTLNISDISFPGDRNAYPSKYIDELEATLLAAGATTSGLKMRLNFVFPAGSDITGFGIASISEGILDGSPDITNSAPTADAGENNTITSEEVAITTVQGFAADADGDALLCRWMEGANVEQDWAPVGVNGECPLALNNFSTAIGTYTLTLEVSEDGGLTSAASDDMILTIDNSAPHAAPGGGGVYEIGTDILLTGDVSDFDGDMLYYEWTEVSNESTDAPNVLCSGYIQSLEGGSPVIVPDCVISGIELGMHTITLTADDDLNSLDSNDITVEIVDTTVPTLETLAGQYLLWPPNHVMVEIPVKVNASDNSGLPVTLSVSVASNEPEAGLGDGDIGPDWFEPVIDQDEGMIYLQLRRERSGSGDGRTYTVTITATDDSENSSNAYVHIQVPHDKSKK